MFRVIILIGLLSFYFLAFSYADTAIGGGITWVKFPADESRKGFTGRAMWFHESQIGFKLDFSRYDVGNFPEHRYTVIGGSALYRFKAARAIAPYAGAGFSSATITAIPDGISSAGYSFTDPAINVVVGSQFPINRIIPFAEYQRLMYIGDSDFFGLDKANIISFGVMFRISQ